MIIQTNGGYADFLAIVNTLGRHKDVFFVSFTGLFVIYAIATSVVVNSGNLGTAPSSFAADFPDAVALNSTLNLS